MRDLLKKMRAGNRDRATAEKIVKQSNLFDRDWYLRVYVDVAKSGMDPVAHFLDYGAREGRNPSRNFDTDWYLSGNPDVRDGGQNPLVHYLLYGQHEGRSPASPGAIRSNEWREEVQLSGFFDVDWYVSTYRDVAVSGGHPLDHFVRFGGKELRSPGPRFDAKSYVQTYPEVRASGLDPLAHYLEIGRSKGYKPVTDIYDRWCTQFDTLTDEDRVDLQKVAAACQNETLLIVMAFDAASQHLAGECIKGLRTQLFKNWTAFVIFAPGCDAARLESARAAIAEDDRLHVCVGAPAVPLPTTSCIVIVRDGVVLREHALSLLMHAAKDRAIALVYSDEDSIEKGDRVRPLFKPDYSPELLRHKNYIGACILIKSPDIDAGQLARGMAGTMSPIPQLEGFLRDVATGRVVHLPFILYHNVLSPKYLPPLEVTAPASDNLPSFTIIIPTRDRLELLRPCLESIASKTAYPREKIEIIIVDNGSTECETLEFLKKLSAKGEARVIRDDGRFNFSRLNNHAAAESHGDVLLFLNNDTLVNVPTWLNLIAEQIMQDSVGIVGAKLLYPDGTIQHAGVILGIQGVAGHDGVGLQDQDPQIRFDATREVSAVTGACMAVRRQVFFALGQFDEVTQVAFNDVLLCLESLEHGYRNICIREPLLIHYESKSRGLEDTPAKAARFRREARYAIGLHRKAFRQDRFYNPNLCLQRANALAFPPRCFKPWRDARRDAGRLKILLLSETHQVGHGVAVVLQQQASHLIGCGHDVTIGGPRGAHEMSYDGARRVYLNDPEEAAIFAVGEGIDCVVAQTPLFFSIVRWLGERPKTLFIDYGEPPPELFPESEARRAVNHEKALCFAMADKIFAISASVRAESGEERAGVIPIANSHLGTWSDELKRERTEIRQKLGWADKIVIFNVCRFTQAERRYKGLDTYAEIMKEFQYSRPALSRRMVFVLCGKGAPDDVRMLRDEGFEVFPNVSDREMTSLYAAADIYMNFSRWEGYNLGIGQALALGLPVIASDIPAHRAFNVFTSNETLPVIEKLSAFASVSLSGEMDRKPVVSPWSIPLEKLAKEISLLCAS